MLKKFDLDVELATSVGKHGSKKLIAITGVIVGDVEDSSIVYYEIHVNRKLEFSTRSFNDVVWKYNQLPGGSYDI